MKILYIKSRTHHKNNHAIMHYKRRFEITIIPDESYLAYLDITSFECVISPCEPVDVSKYPNTKFIFGPHFSIFPNKNQLEFIYGKKSIYIQPSEWAAEVWNRCNLKTHVYQLPFGVDTDTFNQINIPEQRNKVFIYHKRRHPNELNALICLLNKNKIEYKVFDYVRRYDESHYLNYLRESKYGIWLDAHESQGFALQEALACNVPLFVWNVRYMSQEYGAGFDNIPAKTISYWDERCGEFFHDEIELESKFNLFLSKLEHYRPREFILENLSIEKCEDKLLELIKQIDC
jgi:hypothetical protein